MTSATTTAVAEYTYYLNMENSISVTPPVITFSPSSCWTISTYVVNKVSDATSIGTWMPVSGTSIQISYLLANWSLKGTTVAVNIET